VTGAQPFPVWVTHARSLTERKQSCAAALERLGWNARFMEERDPRDLGLAFWLRRVRNPRLTWGQISVFAKHEAVLRKVSESDRATLVLEDDPVFDDSFLESSRPYFESLPDRWDLVFLGASCGLERPADPDTPRFARVESTRSMSGYLVTPAAASRLATALNGAPIRKPVDHAVNDLIRALDLRAFWSVPALIGNGSEAGRFARSVVGGPVRRLLGRIRGTMRD
jgi:GR25 family glycosyltransferase involved in LPS biosynthesis